MLEVLYDEDDRPRQLSHRVKAMKSNLHVQRLYEIYEVIQSSIDTHPTGPVDTHPTGPADEPDVTGVLRPVVSELTSRR